MKIRSAQPLRKAVNQLLSRNVETVLRIPGSRRYRQFVQATQDVEKTQAAVLAEVLAYAGESEYGTKHGFRSIAGYSDYRSGVPVNDFEAMRPYVERHCRGEADVLFPGKPLMYNQSSGTTAKPKLIPVTPYDFQRSIKDRGKLWLYSLMRQFPGVYRGKDLAVVSPAVDGVTEDGTPFGSLSGLVYQNIPEFMKLVHSGPYGVMTIQDYESKAYTLLRLALASDITLILTANPSTVLNLVSRADRWKEDLIRDIHDGTLRDDLTIEPQLRREVQAMLTANVKRAKDLEQLASRNERLRPLDYWPNLRLIHVWKHGNCALMLPKLESWFGSDTPILDFGYLASEVMATDVVDPRSDGSILQVCNGFYEFTPFEQGDSPDRDYLRAHELRVGGRYFIYVTTFSGLYRYDMNDVLEVVGQFNQAPLLRFLFKGKGVTSLQGEKLSENQFIGAVQSAASSTGIRHEFFVGFADAEEQRYQVYIELLEDYTADKLAAFSEAIDAALMSANIEYAAKRKSDRLRGVQLVSAGAAFFERYKARRLAEGAQEGQFKWLNLTSQETTKKILDGLVHERFSETPV